MPVLSAPGIWVPNQQRLIDWKWYLAKPVFNSPTGAFEEFANIGILANAKSKKLKLALNAPESASFSLNILDPISMFVEPISTCIVCYKNGKLKWSGPVWTMKEELNESEKKVDITCVGWFQLLMYRLLKTGALAFGAEPPTKGVGPSATTSGLSHTYSSIEPQLMAKDLLERTNYDYPTGITPGVFESQGTGIKWNSTYQKFQNVGQAIQGLANTENGFDFRIDPATLKLNTYYAAVKSGSTVFGRGVDRPNAVFGYGWGPKNLTSLQRTIDGSALVNQMSTIGEFGTYEATEGSSVTKYGLFEAVETQSSIVSALILEALAQVEVATRSAPLRIATFSSAPSNSRSLNVPEPLIDFDIGDFVYLGARYGRTIIFAANGKGPQPTRVFGMTLAIDDNGNETAEDIETTYQGTGVS